MANPLVTVVTPTTGSPSLCRLVESMNQQTVPWVHILLWDDKKWDSIAAVYPIEVDRFEVDMPNGCDRYSIEIPGSFIKGQACGSALRAVGLMAANTPYVTFADSDVWMEPDHLSSLVEAMDCREWAYSVRKIWTNKDEYLGEDHFESVGDDAKRRVPYELVDNNTLMITRRFGVSAAPLYRETKDYNDDRLMYAFLKKYGGPPGKTNQATLNQVCPERLEDMFRRNCTK